MKRLTKLQARIVKAHIEAKINDKWSIINVCTLGEIKDGLTRGKTFKALYDEIEIRYCSVGSIILSNPATFGHMSHSYKTGISKGFKWVFGELGIE